MNEKKINKLSRQTNKEKQKMLFSEKLLSRVDGSPDYDVVELTPVNQIEFNDLMVYRIFVYKYYDMTIVQCFVRSIEQLDKLHKMQNELLINKVKTFPKLTEESITPTTWYNQVTRDRSVYEYPVKGYSFDLCTGGANKESLQEVIDFLSQI